MIEFETVETRNVFKPRWWQLRFHYRMWRFHRDVAKQEAKLIALIGKEMIEDMRRELEREILIGPGTEE